MCSSFKDADNTPSVFESDYEPTFPSDVDVADQFVQGIVNALLEADEHEAALDFIMGLAGIEY